jgi:hypothetical protein
LTFVAQVGVGMFSVVLGAPQLAVGALRSKLNEFDVVYVLARMHVLVGIEMFPWAVVHADPE